MGVEDGLKTRVVALLDEVGELVDNHEFEAGGRALGELKIDPHAASPRVAGAPASFHALYAPLGDLDSEAGLPSGDEEGKLALELPPIECVEGLLPLLTA